MGRTGARSRGLLLLGVTLLLSLCPVDARSDAEIFNMMVQQNYKPEEAPDRFGSRSGYIPVAVRIMLEAIVVDEKGSAVTLQCLQRLTWNDIRLRYRSAPAAGGLIISHAAAGLGRTGAGSSKIWLPSLVYPQALMVDFDNSMDNTFLIRPNGTITWQRRVHLMEPCQIHLNSFPWDVNTCAATIRQDLDGEMLMLNWTRKGGRPAQAGPHFSINGFELTSLVASSSSRSMNDVTGASLRSKSLALTVTFKRQSSYYVINDIIPTSILVLAAYMTFWLTPDAVVVRSLVTSFMLLACFLVSAIAGKATPLSATLTALNVWNLLCLFFVLWPLVQSLVVYHMVRRPGGAGGSSSGSSGSSGSAESGELATELPKPPSQNGNGEADPEAITSDALPPPPTPNDDLRPLPPPPRPRRLRRTAGISSRMVDVVSRVLYPLTFVIVVIVFSVLYS